MKTLYIDCNMGAAGDMLSAALLELIPDSKGFIEKINGLNIPGVSITAEESVKCGIKGTHVSVKVNGKEESEDMHHDHHHDHGEHEHHHHDHEEHEHHHHEHDHHHHHSSMHDIEHIVNDMSVSDRVKKDVLSVYSLIAEAESHVHGKPVTDIHFHEVGTMDAVADVTAVCMLMEILDPGQVIVSPIHVGSGQVRCAHGILPVPAPATAYILRDVPIYSGKIQSELCTPTGAALLKHFATSFGEMPVMRTTAIGYGMGKKDFDMANCVRAFIGETQDSSDVIVQLNCNLDDVTGEEIGFAQERLLEEGALEVFTIPVQMKKNRPGNLLSVMCKEEDRDKMVELIFRYTTTLGIRESINRRYVLSRKTEKIETEFGEVRKKVSSGYGVTREKFEYEDLADIARKNEMSISQVKDQICRTDCQK